MSTGRAQRVISRLDDNTRTRRLTNMLSEEGRRHNLDLLQELRDPDTNHDWVVTVGPTEGPVVSPDEHVARLCHCSGCNFLAEPTTCYACTKPYHLTCTRAGCCAQAEAIRRRYSVARQRLAVANSDPTAVREEVVAGDQLLRPGDITTSGILDRKRAAIDVGITSRGRQCSIDPVHDYFCPRVLQHLVRTQRYRVYGGDLVPGRTTGEGAKYIISRLCNYAEKYHPDTPAKDVQTAMLAQGEPRCWL